MLSRSDPIEQLRAHLRRERHAGDDHPSPERIVAYCEGRLQPEEAEGVRTHLVGCPDCATQLRELAALLEGEDDAAADTSAEELAAAWQRQRARRLPATPPVRPERSRPVAPNSRWAWATAASMGLAAALLAIVAVDQRQSLQRLERPQANPPLVNLAPLDSMRRGTEGIPTLRLPAHTERVWVILNPATELAFRSYDVEVIAPGGEVALRLEGLERSEVDNFRLEIPRAALTAEGDYRVLLIGTRAQQRRVVQDFAFGVRSLQPSSVE